MQITKKARPFQAMPLVLNSRVDLPFNFLLGKSSKTNQAGTQQEHRGRFWNSRITEWKIDLQNSWASTALAIHQLKREVPRWSRVRHCCSDGRRGPRVEPQIETTDDQGQTIIMGHGERLPIGDSDETRKFDEGAKSKVIH